jgi:hypothetical protein
MELTREEWQELKDQTNPDALTVEMPRMTLFDRLKAWWNR